MNNIESVLILYYVLCFRILQSHQIKRVYYTMKAPVDKLARYCRNTKMNGVWIHSQLAEK